jgi:hypothetical protein
VKEALWLLFTCSLENSEENSKEIAGGAPQVARVPHASEGSRFDAAPAAGSHHTDSTLQSGLHVLQ